MQQKSFGCRTPMNPKGFLCDMVAKMVEGTIGGFDMEREVGTNTNANTKLSIA